MSSWMNMSLKEIIKKNKMNRYSKLKRLNNHKKHLPMQKPKITDARDALTKKNARIQLHKMRLHKMEKNQQTSRHFTQNATVFIITIPNKESSVYNNGSRRVVAQPLSVLKGEQPEMRQFVKERFVGGQSLDVMPNTKPIQQTVQNDIEIIDDPMEEYNRTDVTSKKNCPPRSSSIRKKRPIVALRSENRDQNMEKPNNVEHKIIVSNLSDTVTGRDIQELFGEVDGMLQSRLFGPGTAEVVYKSLEDAQRAAVLYHNRELDGQPMNCLVVPFLPRILPRRRYSGHYISGFHFTPTPRAAAMRHAIDGGKF